jgi:hypothetical protein
MVSQCLRLTEAVVVAGARGRSSVDDWQGSPRVSLATLLHFDMRLQSHIKTVTQHTSPPLYYSFTDECGNHPEMHKRYASLRCLPFRPTDTRRLAKCRLNMFVNENVRGKLTSILVFIAGVYDSAQALFT